MRYIQQQPHLLQFLDLGCKCVFVVFRTQGTCLAAANADTVLPPADES